MSAFSSCRCRTVHGDGGCIKQRSQMHIFHLIRVDPQAHREDSAFTEAMKSMADRDAYVFWFNDLRVSAKCNTEYGGHRYEVSQRCKRACRAVVVTVAQHTLSASTVTVNSN